MLILRYYTKSGSVIIAQLLNYSACQLPKSVRDQLHIQSEILVQRHRAFKFGKRKRLSVTQEIQHAELSY